MPMKTLEKPWIELAYEIFARKGPQGLTIEGLSKKIGKNKSSFYHHFADLEIFVNILLRHHLDQAKVIASKEANCTTLEALIEVLLEHKTDLLFSRQLRVYRENPKFEECFEKVNAMSVPAIIGLWSELIGLEDRSYLSGLVLQLSLENFYLQITEKTLHHDWLVEYFMGLKTMVDEFKKGQPISPMNGGV